ncbi:NAD(P)H-dependent glycerol-3-phosphate dehydrogenase [Mycoplasmopsis columbinasalis]|uniref:Glycerol-3-phosphate dehydrogenase n=1 Tax=Mycoplasmopsis columbinasalis TaxID=114880 RepID=A0A449B9W7_9BACT|nr:NAD(P)H-dependent glycerol-3-phosphate dehydrogenase [Mycoplasmopsis columbinasalis]VEU77955.1 glycerol-3-phosphate dehydrogenase [Mycoplasmopsis columbinasalis]
MAKITFIGTGAWASGLATILAENNHKVTMWGINRDEINDINRGLNRVYFGNNSFKNARKIEATDDLEKALASVHFLVLAVPSSAFDKVIPNIKTYLGDRQVDVINVAKGIDAQTQMFYSEIVRKEFGSALQNYCTILGPSFATEVFAGDLTVANVVGPKQNYLKKVARTFNNSHFKLVPHKDENSAQLFAALKNVYAIGTGMAGVLFPSKNTEAALLTIAVKEINEIKSVMFPHSSKTFGFEYAAIGDLFLTCTSLKSRNYSFGVQIAQVGVTSALELNTKTIEGYRSASIFRELIEGSEYQHLKLPFLKNIMKVLFENKRPDKLLVFLANVD